MTIGVMSALNPPEWLGYPEYHRVDFSGFEGGNCPVCGAEDGNCKGNGEFDHMIEFKPEAKPDPAATFSVPQRIYTEEQIGSRIVRKLLYGIGDRITVVEAKRLGLLR